MEMINKDDIIFLVKKEVDKDGDNCISVGINGSAGELMLAMDNLFQSVFECFNEIEEKEDRAKCYITLFKIFQNRLIEFSKK